MALTLPYPALPAMDKECLSLCQKMRDLESELDLLDYEGGMLVGGKLCEIDIEGIISYYLAEHLPAPHFLLPVPSFLVCFSFLCGGFYLLSFLLLVSLD